MESILAILQAHRAAIFFALLACGFAYVALTLAERTLARRRRRVLSRFRRDGVEAGHFVMSTSMTVFERSVVTSEVFVLGSRLREAFGAQGFDVRITVGRESAWSKDYDLEKFTELAASIVMDGAFDANVTLALVATDNVATIDPSPPFEEAVLAVARREFDEFRALPRYVAIDRPIGRILFPMYMFPHGDRRNDFVLSDLREDLVEDDARGVATMAEAWMVATDTKTSESLGDLSTHPDRFEAVIVTVEHRDLDGGSPRLWNAKITRDASGKPSLGEWEFQQGDAGGRLVGLLPPPKGQA